MSYSAENIVSDLVLSPGVLQKSLLNQHGIVVWLMGLSGAGKSTIAGLLEKKLLHNNYFSVLLDGDELRAGINKDLSFTEDDRTENIRRVAEIAGILVRKNIIVICSLITPLRKHRDLAAEIIGKSYYEVFVDCPLLVCEQRDVKGLYQKARNNEITNFTGIGADFEPSETPSLTLHTNHQLPQQSGDTLYSHIIEHIRVN